MQKTLLTFVGANDPFSLDQANERGRQPGPVLTLLEARPELDAVYLLFTADEGARQRAASLEEEIVRRGLARVVRVPTEISDPSDIHQILAALRRLAEQLAQQDNLELFVAPASGTPAMYACWLMLTAADEIHARLLYVRRPGQVSAERLRVSEINPRLEDFPRIEKRSVMFQTGPVGPAHRVDPEKLGLFGTSRAFRRCVEHAWAYAEWDFPVLIQGETGVGKEGFARLIHESSARRDRPFVALNCGALSADLVESELFGHAKGAFTGAVGDKPGAFVEADGGTLFLDEIGDMPPGLQVKLLRVLQERRVRPVGGSGERQVDVRIIVATHRDLIAAIEEGRFREDLYHRVSTLMLDIPPLRKRLEDLELIANAMIVRDGCRDRRLTAKAIKKLRAHPWRGNVRELQNVLRRALVLNKADRIEADAIVLNPVAGAWKGDGISLPELYEGFSWIDYKTQLRDRLFVKALEQTGGNRAAASRLLGVSHATLNDWSKKRKDFA